MIHTKNLILISPLGKTGDCYARYLVRMAEMYESIKIMKQAIENMPDGAV